MGHSHIPITFEQTRLLTAKRCCLSCRRHITCNDVSEKASPRKGFSTFPFRLWLARPGAKKTLPKSDLDETLDGRLPPEDSSDFDDFWTELIVMT